MEWGGAAMVRRLHSCDLPTLRHSGSAPEAGLALPELGERSALVPASRSGLEIASERKITVRLDSVALCPVQ